MMSGEPTTRIERRMRRGRWMTHEEHLALLNEHDRLLCLGLTCHRACCALVTSFGFNNFARVQELVLHTVPVILVEDGEQWDEDERASKKVYIGKHAVHSIWKIGHSNTPEDRSKHLRYVIILDAHREPNLHARFRRYRIPRRKLVEFDPRLMREWHYLGPELRKFILQWGGTIPDE